jgi:Protein of unknown function (DUF3048) N-terminal domain/Protein of unknown function (DUF3048) C-terminal domain
VRRLAAAGCVLLLASIACSLPGSRPAVQHGGARPSPRPAATPTPTGVQFVVDGVPAAGAVQVTARSHLRIAFSAQVPPAAVAVTVDGQALPADALGWSPDLLSVEVPLSAMQPYRPAQIAVAVPPTLAAPGPLQVTMVATVPANATTGVQAGFRPQTPIEIVVENSGPARPQSGLQDADAVYEYLSEYSVTRMTAIYFSRVPNQVGPVRSCRMVNTFLGFAYAGVTMCSGVSDGTNHWVVGSAPGSRKLPAVLDPYDRGAHFFRVGSKAAPHNLYTSSQLATGLRTSYTQEPGAYAVDPPHADVVAGQPAPAPAVPLHGVTYAYDPGSGQYLRFNDGAAFSDQETSQQVHAKNVVLLHVPFHDAGWVEDDNGGAHSVFYDMLGTGPAEVYSDGQVVHATWHMGTPGQAYFDNHAPVWFTDEAGQPLLLNTGLTWIHVLGNGQDRCPDRVQTCG